MKKFVNVLASGGIDSTACIHFYKKLNFYVDAIYIDFEQKARIQEYKSVKAISKYYKIDLQKIRINNLSIFKTDSSINGRNALFYFVALMNFKYNNGLISSGIHYGTPYYDCSEDFMKQVQVTFEGYTKKTIIPTAPFLNFTKQEIFEYCLIENIPTHLTYSCENGLKQPCGECLTCKDLNILYASEN